MKKSLLSWSVVPLVAIIVVALDQWTKSLVRANIALWDGFAPFPALASYFKIVHWSNTGAAFGLFQGGGSVLVVVALIVVVVVLIYSRQLPTDNWAVRICLGMQLGGAIGNNLIDRLRFGHVTDFLLFTLPVGDKVYLWPAFNVADSSIVVSVILLVILMLRMEGKQVEGKKADGKQAEA